MDYTIIFLSFMIRYDNDMIRYDNDIIYLLTATVLTAGGSSTVHIYTQTIHRTQGNITRKTVHNKNK
jgi:hypothetical protein